MSLARRAVYAFAFLLVGSTAASGLGERLGGLVSVVQAQESAQVWVNTRSAVYHCPGSRYFGNTKSGEYMAEADARASGNRPAYGQTCGASAGAAASPVVAQQLTAEPRPNEGATGTQVWVNTRSGVYHCPGTQYYRNTKTGQFMTESEAKAAGNRPAYGRPCS